MLGGKQMTTEDQKLTNGSVKPADDPRKYSVNVAQIVRHWFCWCSHSQRKNVIYKTGIQLVFHRFTLEMMWVVW